MVLLGHFAGFHIIDQGTVSFSEMVIEFKIWELRPLVVFPKSHISDDTAWGGGSIPSGLHYDAPQGSAIPPMLSSIYNMKLLGRM